MIFKALFILLVITISDVNTKVCRTQQGVAWCEDNSNTCYYRTGGTFQKTYCRKANPTATFNFNRANCRKCPNKSCTLLREDFTENMNVYHEYNSYLLTRYGWCYTK